jgi:capsular exopolysaccharide synthesis family protein
MSRIDEALRRAAEGGRGESPDESPQPLTTGVDPAEFAEEPFPIEMPDRRRVRSVAPVAVPSPDPASVAVLQPPKPEPVKPDPAAAASAVHPPTMLQSERPSIFSRIDSKLAAKVVVDQRMEPASREQYRRLAAELHHRQAATGLKVVMIASAVMGEGKTLTASNLALTLSESYKRSVLLIDADLRRPSLNAVFGMNGTPGLAEGLMAADGRKLSIHQVSSNLTILPAGKPNNDPMAGLTSVRMRQLIDEARAAFDWVIIDTPPVGLLTDASLLVAMADGAVLVVEAGSTPYDLVKRAVDAIGASRVLGVVLNRAVVTARTYGYGYGYYGGYGVPAGSDDGR